MPSSSLIPDDPSVLLTTAGMQQFKPYFVGKANPMKDFGSLNTASIQKSFRTSDIDEVGDERHLTFFEMMGNFSFGGYFKKEAIRYAKEFLDSISLPIEYVTIFRGDESVPKDEESKKIWEELGVKDIREKGREDNFWGPTGGEGPCGPTTEIYIDGIEVWNIVFNQFYSDKDAKLTPLKIQGVDTGMGLERLAMVSQGKANIFQTDLFAGVFPLLNSLNSKELRVIADHLRASMFLLADGVRPSNKEAGYVLRRLIRRLLVYSRKLHIPMSILEESLKNAMRFYGTFYPETENQVVSVEFMKEVERFDATLEKGLKEFEKRFPSLRAQNVGPGGKIQPLIGVQKIGKEAFDLYQTYGFPVEVIKELLEKEIYIFDEDEFRKKVKEEFKKHQEISRAGQERKFGGHGLLLDTGELRAANEEELKKVTRLHTATHLTQAALRKILGESVHQAGSDITVERMRFDFTFDRKLTPEEIQKIEDWVNGVVERDAAMGFQEMPYSEAIQTGALYFAKEKYPPTVKVYSAADPASGEVYTKELCGGPHVTHTGEVGKFKILKEESISSGIRRLRATLE